MTGFLRRLKSVAARVVRVIPEPWLLRLPPRLGRVVLGFDRRDIPPPLSVDAARPAPGRPDDGIRLLVAPTNSAGQGYQWARAAERVDGVVAVNQQIESTGGYGFASDAAVPQQVFLYSRSWADAEREAILRQFTHVLIEAERPVMGRAFGMDVRAEVAAMRAAGVQVAFVSHGSDLRLPSRHREIDQWSPFHGNEWALTPELERQALAHREILRDTAAPVFVSTPDLLLDWPAAHWLPVVVDPALWRAEDDALTRPVPVVLHVPSKSVVKGTAMVSGIMRDLDAQGVIEYRERSGIPAAQMPELFSQADVVVEQFRIGTYSVTAVEAMAAGRLVIGHLHDQVRESVAEHTGVEVPVVEATPDTLAQVLADVAAEPEAFREVARRGPKFVAAVHDGAASAQVLRRYFLQADPAQCHDVSFIR